MKHPEFLETSSDVLIGATHLLQTHAPVPRAKGLGGPLAEEQGGQLGILEYPRDQEDPD